MIYVLKKGSWNTYVAKDGTKMPRTETIRLKDLQVGDIIFERTEASDHGYESLTVTAIRKYTGLKGANRPKQAMSIVLAVAESGKVVELGPVYSSASYMRQTTEANFRKKEKADTIIGHRSHVRTVLGTAESARGERPKQKYLQGYWDEMQGIVETLIALERRMTIDAGRDPEDPKDQRKRTNHRGRAR